MDFEIERRLYVRKQVSLLNTSSALNIEYIEDYLKTVQSIVYESCEANRRYIDFEPVQAQSALVIPLRSVGRLPLANYFCVNEIMRTDKSRLKEVVQCV